MSVSTCYHCSFSKKSGCSFSYVATASLKSSGWISKLCHYCFAKQWMWFSIHCQSSFSKSSQFSLRFVMAAHLISSGWISLCCHCSLSKSSECCFQFVATAHLVWQLMYFYKCCHCCLFKQWMWFPVFATSLFRKAVDMDFHVFSLHI